MFVDLAAAALRMAELLWSFDPVIKANIRDNGPEAGRQREPGLEF